MWTCSCLRSSLVWLLFLGSFLKDSKTFRVFPNEKKYFYEDEARDMKKEHLAMLATIGSKSTLFRACFLRTVRPTC